MISTSGQDPISIKTYANRLIANKYISISENRFKNVESHEAFDFFIKRPNEVDVFNKVNYNESDEIIRRGICLCFNKKTKVDPSHQFMKDNKVYVQNLIESADNVSILRKGLKKFFEIDLSALYNKQIVISDSGNNLWNTNIDFSVPYTIYITKKEDGENAQLSYSRDIDKFIIGSKNFTISISNAEDLNNYTNVDATHCFAIATFLMEKIEALDADKQQKLKELLESNTLIGEYIGDAKFAHVVHTNKKTVKFFSMVAKNRLTNELDDLEQTMKTIIEFGFEFVHYEKHTKDTRELLDVLNEYAYKTANMGFNDVQEGFVAYIFTSGREIYFKFKSLAYKIEKVFLAFEESILKLSINTEEQTKGISGPYVNQKVGLTGTTSQQNFLNDYQTKTINAIDLDSITRSKLISLINLRLDKVIQKVKQYEPILKPTVDVFIANFFNRCLAVIQKYYFKPIPTFFNVKGQLTVIKHRKPIIVLVPMSIPGSGKSYYGEVVVTPLCEQNNYHYSFVSSDKIRNMFIQEYMDNNQTTDVDLGFKRTDKKASQAFKNEFYNALRLAMEDHQPKCNGYVIFRDRNHPNLKLLDTIIHDVKSVLHGYNAVFILMVPRIMPYLNQGLSYEDLFKCLYRVKNRQNHETLPYKGFETFINVMYNCYMSFRSIHKFELNYDGIIEYYVEEEFTEKGKEAVSELIDVFKDYNYYKRDRKPVNEKHLHKIRDRYLEAVEKLEIVPKNFDIGNKEKIKILADEVEKALKQNFGRLDLVIMENHEFLIRDCVAQLRHSVEQTYLRDFDDMMKRTNEWHDVDSLYITAFKASRDRQENAQRFTDFKTGIRVPAKVYLITYIVAQEVRLYILKEHRVYIESQTPYFVLRRRAHSSIDEEYLSSQVSSFTQNTAIGSLLKLEPEKGEKKSTIYLYKLKNEKILDALCDINYSWLF